MSGVPQCFPVVGHPPRSREVGPPLQHVAGLRFPEMLQGFLLCTAEDRTPNPLHLPCVGLLANLDRLIEPPSPGDGPQSGNEPCRASGLVRHGFCPSPASKEHGLEQVEAPHHGKVAQNRVVGKDQGAHDDATAGCSDSKATRSVSTSA